MTPVYFPFTFISQPVAEILTACFGPMVVYQPMGSIIPQVLKKLEKKGLIDIRIPLKGDEEKIISICKDYRRWIDTHQGSENAFLKIQGDKIPFFDDTSPSQVKAALKKTGRETSAPDIPEQLFSARVFLYAAQQFDKETWEIAEDLISVEKMEENLVGDLKGETPERHHPTAEAHVLPTADPGAYMTVARLKAWAHLFLNDREAFAENGIVLFITTSRSVFEHVMDIAPESKSVLQMDIPTRFDAEAQLTRRVAEHLQHMATDDCSMPREPDDFFDRGHLKFPASGSITIHFLHKTTPRKFFMHGFAPGMIHDKSDQFDRENGKMLVAMINLTN